MKLFCGQVLTNKKCKRITAVVKASHDHEVEVQIQYNGHPAAAGKKYQTLSLDQLETEFTLEPLTT